MSAVTESDLKEIKDLINARFDKLSEDLTEIKVKLAKIESKTDGLEKPIDDINGRLNIVTVGFLGIVGVLVTGILGIVGKVVFFPNP